MEAEADISPAALTLPWKVSFAVSPLLNGIAPSAWINTCPPAIVISIELVVRQSAGSLPGSTVVVPTYLPSKTVAGAWAAEPATTRHEVPSRDQGWIFIGLLMFVLRAGQAPSW